MWSSSSASRLMSVPFLGSLAGAPPPRGTRATGRARDPTRTATGALARIRRVISRPRTGPKLIPSVTVSVAVAMLWVACWPRSPYRPTSNAINPDRGKRGTPLDTSKARLVSLRLALVTLCTVLVAGLGFTSVATAAPPTREPVVLPAEFTLADTLGGNPCGFPVLVTVLNNKEKLTTFTRDGVAAVFRVTGSLKVRLTNTLTGTAIERNISGPTRLTPNSDGSITQETAGPGLWAFDPGVAPGLPRAAITKGRTVSVINSQPNGDFLFISQKGSVEDVCAALAAP